MKFKTISIYIIIFLTINYIVINHAFAAGITYVQEVAVLPTSGVNGTAFSPAHNTTQGNHLILLMSNSGSGVVVSGVTDTQSNTWHVDSTQANASLASVSIASVYLTTALTTSDTITVTLSGTGTFRGGLLEEYSGLKTTSWNDVNAGNTGTDSTSMTTGTTATTGQTNELTIEAFSLQATATSFTKDTNYSNFTTQIDGRMGGAYRILTSTGTQNATGAFGNVGTNWAGAIATYKSAETNPASSSYQLINYGFGSGGTTNSNSSAYQLQGIAGELEMASSSSNGYLLLPGLTYTLQPNVPPAPAFTNPSNNYNLLNLTINQGGNLSDVNYAIEVSTDPSFLTNIQYVQNDNTLGSTIFWQSYTSWFATGGAASGTNIIGLTPGTTYYARVQANRGTFTQETYSGVASAATVNATFTFNLQTTNQSIPPYTVGIGVVNPGQVTTSWQKVIATISTNAAKGGTVYINDTNAGLKSATAGNHVIATVQNDLSSGGVTEGYGARGVSVSASTGNMELLSPYNLGNNNVGLINTSKNPIADSTAAPVTSGVVNFELKVKAGTSTPPAVDYADTITVVASGSF